MTMTPFLAMGPPPQGASGGGAAQMMVMMVSLGLMILIFYFLIIRPQQQRQKQHERMLKDLKKGDRVLTSGGLFVTVLNVKDDRIVAVIGEDVKVEIAKPFVQAVIEKG